jgi:hypothetical protein
MPCRPPRLSAGCQDFREPARPRRSAPPVRTRPTSGAGRRCRYRQRRRTDRSRRSAMAVEPCGRFGRAPPCRRSVAPRCGKGEAPGDSLPGDGADRVINARPHRMRFSASNALLRAPRGVTLRGATPRRRPEYSRETRRPTMRTRKSSEAARFCTARGQAVACPLCGARIATETEAARTAR